VVERINLLRCYFNSIESVQKKWEKGTMKKIISLIVGTLLTLSLVSTSLIFLSPITGELTVDEYTLAMWRFNEGQGQIVHDESSHNNDGTLGPTPSIEARDPSWTTGFTGQLGDYAISLDDWYDYVNVADNPDDSLDLLHGDEFTIEFWAYVRSVSRLDRGAGDHWNHFICKNDDKPPTGGYTVDQAARYPLMSASFVDNATASFRVVQCLPPPTLQWTHIMFTYDGQYCRTYFDNVLQNMGDVGHHYVGGNDYPLSIGKSLQTDDPWDDSVDCVIDEVRISSIARVPANVDFDPDMLNLKSRGKYVTAYLELPEEYDVSTIDVSTILLNDTISVASHPTTIGDYDDDGILDLMVKFDRDTVITYIEANINMTNLAEQRAMTISLIVVGTLNSGTVFQGEDTIIVRCPLKNVGIGHVLFAK